MYEQNREAEMTERDSEWTQLSMPLLDHFHPPLAPRRHWESFHVNWAEAIADDLNESLLPEGYFAEEHARLGPRVEIDVATFTDPGQSGRREGGTATLPPSARAPPAAAMVVPAAFPDSIEILVFESEGGARLVAAIELVSPGNKDRDAQRQAFAVKCASYLCRGISLIVIDIVSSRRANLHNEIMRVLGHGDAFAMPARRFCMGWPIDRSSAMVKSKSKCGRHRWKSAGPCRSSPWR